jgi:hypothetical protein
MDLSARTRKIVLLWPLAAAIGLLTGCSSVKVTGTPRSGTEQLLLSGAWDAALCSVDFQPLAGRRVYVDGSQVSVVDKGWILSTIRRALLEHGAMLSNTQEDAQVVVEVALGAYGTDERDCKVGITQLGFVPFLFGVAAAPGMQTGGASAGLSLTQTNRQDAMVKAAMFAYDAKTGHLVWESGTLTNAEGLRDSFILGTGPLRTTSLREMRQYPAEVDVKIRRRLLRALRSR